MGHFRSEHTLVCPPGCQSVWVSSAAITSPNGRIRGVPPTQGDKFAVGGRVIEQKHTRIKAWRRMITVAIRQSTWRQIPGPTSVRLIFWLPRPGSHYRTGRYAGLLKPDAPQLCTSKPDVDKLARAVLDALTQCQAIGDDALVVDLAVSKRYCDQTGQVGVDIHAAPGHTA